MNDAGKPCPTGHSPEALPLYSELDSGKFEQFCTNLLNLQPVVPCLRNGHVVNRRVMNATRLLSEAEQKGVDIRAEAEEGEVWFFQCKHVKDFGRAKVAEAIELAGKGFLRRISSYSLRRAV